MKIFSRLVRRIKKRHVVPLLGLASSTLLCIALIHFWLANWTAQLLELPLPSAYSCLLLFLVLLQTWRLVQILRDKDIGTQWVNRLMKTIEPTHGRTAMAVEKDDEWHRQVNRRIVAEAIIAVIAGIVGVIASLAYVYRQIR